MQKRSPFSDSLSAGSQAAARDLADFAAPLILARVLRAAALLVRPERKPKGIRRSISESGEGPDMYMDHVWARCTCQRSRPHEGSDLRG